jgi:hypothetical protein
MSLSAPDESKADSKIQSSDDEDERKEDEDEDEEADDDYMPTSRTNHRDHELDVDSDSTNYTAKEKAAKSDFNSPVATLNKSSAEKPRSILSSSTVRGKKRVRKAGIGVGSSSSSPSKVSFKRRMDKLIREKVQDRNRDYPFQFSHKPGADAKGMCLCVACDTLVDYKKLSTLRNHLKSPTHVNHHNDKRDKVNPQETLFRTLVLKGNKEITESGIGLKTDDEIKVQRLKLCYALLLDGVPLNVLNHTNPNGLSGLFKTTGIDAATARPISDCIPQILQLEKDKTLSELGCTKNIGVIFDATPDRGEAFGVVVRYLDSNYNIHHRCISLVFYDQTFKGEHIGMVSIEFYFFYPIY